MSGDFTWRVSDCEELGGLLTGDYGVGFWGLFLNTTPKRLLPDLTVVALSKDDPLSVDLTMF